MKKLLAMLLATLLLGVGALGLAGCGPKDGTFYTLQEAYDSGYLTREDLMSIAYYQNGGREYNEEIMPEDYAPIPKDPEELSESTSLRICSTAAADWNAGHPDADATAEDFMIDYYYGTYGAFVAIMMSDIYTLTTGAVRYGAVGEVNFYYSGGRDILIWENL